jgi:hypothetical protein
MTIVLQAGSAEREFELTPFRITWDGEWENGAAEMAKHLIIKRITRGQPPA